MRVYKELGDGFDEDIYQRALAYEFRKAKVKYMRETNIETFYRGIFQEHFKIDELSEKLARTTILGRFGLK